MSQVQTNLISTLTSTQQTGRTTSCSPQVCKESSERQILLNERSDCVLKYTLAQQGHNRVESEYFSFFFLTFLLEFEWYPENILLYFVPYRSAESDRDDGGNEGRDTYRVMSQRNLWRHECNRRTSLLCIVTRHSLPCMSMKDFSGKQNSTNMVLFHLVESVNLLEGKYATRELCCEFIWSLIFSQCRS